MFNDEGTHRTFRKRRSQRRTVGVYSQDWEIPPFVAVPDVVHSYCEAARCLFRPRLISCVKRESRC